MYTKEEFDQLWLVTFMRYISPLSSLFRILLLVDCGFEKWYTIFVITEWISLVIFAVAERYGNMKDISVIFLWLLHSLVAFPLHSWFLGNNAVSCMIGYAYLYIYFSPTLIRGIPFYSVMGPFSIMVFLSPIIFGGMTVFNSMKYCIPLFLCMVGLKMMLTLIDRFQQDMTIRQKENILTQSKNEVFKIASHELRNPLQALTYSIHYMSSLEMNKVLIDVVDDLKSTASVLTSMVENVLDFNMIEKKMLDLKPTDFSILDLVGTVMNVYYVTAVKKGLEMYLWVDPTIPSTLFGDPVRLTQVFSNLCVNAVKFTERGHIDIKVEKIQGKVPGNISIKFSVIDTGMGMKKEDLNKLFKPYSRLHDTDGETKGWGLGLSILSEIVKVMGGEFGVSSDFGKGSTFWVSIPFNQYSSELIQESLQFTNSFDVYTYIRDEKLEKTLNSYLISLGISIRGTFHVGVSVQDPIIVLTDVEVKDRKNVRFVGVRSPLNLKKLHIDLSSIDLIKSPGDIQKNLNKYAVLCIEDDKMVSKIEAKILEAEGHIVTCAFDGLEGLNYLETCKVHPDVILVDNQMPNLTGIGLIEKLRNHTILKLQTIPTIMMSGTVNDMLKNRLKEYQIPLIQKPVKPKELLNTIQLVVKKEKR